MDENFVTLNDGDDDKDFEEVNFQELSNPIIWRPPFCGFVASRSIPYFEFSPQMSRMIRANIGCRSSGLGYPTPD